MYTQPLTGVRHLLFGTRLPLLYYFVCASREGLLFRTKIVSMIRKYHNHKLQTNLWYREEEPHNNHETPGRQTKQSNQLSLPHRDDCKTRMDTK